MVKYLIAGLSALSIALGSLWMHERDTRKAAEAVALVAHQRSVVLQKAWQEDSARTAESRQLAKKEQERAKQQVAQADAKAEAAKVRTDSAVAVLRVTLTDSQKVLLASVEAAHEERHIADAERIAALGRLVAAKDAEIDTWKSENEALKRLNDGLRVELEAQKPRSNLKNDIISMVAGAVIYAVVDRAAEKI